MAQASSFDFHPTFTSFRLFNDLSFPMARQFQTLCGAVALVLVAGAAASEERELSSTYQHLDKFSEPCRDRLTKLSDKVKTTRAAKCALCSQCSSYTSGWCKNNCKVRTQVTDKDHLDFAAGNVNCIPDDEPYVPKECIDIQYRRLYQSDEERELSKKSDEERELSSTYQHLDKFSEPCRD